MNLILRQIEYKVFSPSMFRTTTFFVYICNV